MPRELDSAAAHGGRDYATVRIIAESALSAGGAPHRYLLALRDDVPAELADRREPEHQPLIATQLRFQEGPIQEVGINGLTHEALLAVVIDRLEHFQRGPFPCAENANALGHLVAALEWLNTRTQRRAARGVEGRTEA